MCGRDVRTPLGKTRWGADVLVRELLPSRQKCSRSDVRTRRPHPTWENEVGRGRPRPRADAVEAAVLPFRCADEASALHLGERGGARTPSSASCCRRGSSAPVPMCGRDVRTPLGRTRWGADALVRELLPSRQQCSRSDVRTRRPHPTWENEVGRGRPRPRAAAVEAAVLPFRCADEASALHLGGRGGARTSSSASCCRRGSSAPLPVASSSSASCVYCIHVQTAIATIAATMSPMIADGIACRVRFTPTAPK